MRRTFLTNLLFSLILNFLIKPAYLFGVEVGVQNKLGAEEYGLYFALLNSAFLLQIINDFGIQIFNNRQVAIESGQLKVLFPGLLFLKLTLAGAYLLLLCLLGYFLGFMAELQLLVFIGINLALTSFILFIRSGFSGLGYYRIDSALSVLDKLLMLLIIGGMLLFSGNDGFSVYHFVFGQMAALLLTLIISWRLLGHYTTLQLAWPSSQQLRNLTVKAFPYALVVFLMTLYTRLDGVMLIQLLPEGEYQAGIYAAGYRILDALNMVAFLFASLLLPMFSNTLSSPDQLRALLYEGFRYMFLLVVPVCVIGILLREDIMLALYREADAYWGDVFALLLATFFSMGMMYIFGTLVTAAGRIRAMNLIFVISVLLNVLFNFLLIPHYGAAGAAGATLITQFFAVCGIVFLCTRLIPLSFSSTMMMQTVGFVMICILSGWMIERFFDLSWYWTVCMYLPCVLLGAFLFRMLRWTELRSALGRQ